MALFMDVHRSLPEGATAEDVAQAHRADLETQDRYGVRYLNYWADADAGSARATSVRNPATPRGLSSRVTMILPVVV